MHAGYSGLPIRKIKDRLTGQVETELVPGKVWLVLKALYTDSLFMPAAAAKASKALTLSQVSIHCAGSYYIMRRVLSDNPHTQGRKMNSSKSKQAIPHFIEMYVLTSTPLSCALIYLPDLPD